MWNNLIRTLMSALLHQHKPKGRSHIPASESGRSHHQYQEMTTPSEKRLMMARTWSIETSMAKCSCRSTFPKLCLYCIKYRHWQYIRTNRIGHFCNRRDAVTLDSEEEMAYDGEGYTCSSLWMWIDGDTKEEEVPLAKKLQQKVDKISYSYYKMVCNYIFTM